MSSPELPDEHGATEALDELFAKYGVTRESAPKTEYTEEQMYTYHHFRTRVECTGGESLPTGLHTTSKGVVLVEDANETYVRTVVDTKAEVEDEHPAAY